MWRTRPLLGFLFALLVLMAVVGIVFFGMALLSEPAPGVTQDNFYRLQIGMNEDEVEARLGGAAGTEEKKGRNSSKCWLGQENTCVRILFGPNGVVLDGIFVRDGRQDGDLKDDVTDRLFRWFPF